MSAKPKLRDLKAILKETMEINSFLTYKDLMFICSRPERTVFKWLSGEVAPHRYDLVLIHNALYRAKYPIPRELKRLYDAVVSRPRSWATKNNSGNEYTVWIGEKLRENPFKNTYPGQKQENLSTLMTMDTTEMTGKDVAEALGVAYTTANRYLAELKKPYKKRGRKISVEK